MKTILESNNLTLKQDNREKILYLGKEKANPQYKSYSVWYKEVRLKTSFSYVEAMAFIQGNKDYKNLS